MLVACSLRRFLCCLFRLFFLLKSDTFVGGCAAQFSHFFSSFHSIFLVFLNILDIRSAVQRSDLSPLLEVSAVFFVFIVGVLLYNLLIAFFSDEINRISANREVILLIDRLWMSAHAGDAVAETVAPRVLFAALSRISLRQSCTVLDNSLHCGKGEELLAAAIDRLSEGVTSSICFFCDISLAAERDYCYIGYVEEISREFFLLS